MSKPKPVPIITNVSIFPSQIPIGKNFKLFVSATNEGDTADVQTVSIAFPNISAVNKNSITDYNNTSKDTIKLTGTKTKLYSTAPVHLGRRYKWSKLFWWRSDNNRKLSIDRILQ